MPPRAASSSSRFLYCPSQTSDRCTILRRAAAARRRGRAEAVAARWDELKAQEGKGGIDDIPQALPALIRAAKVGKKASKVGFDWPEVSGPLEKVEEELGELRQAITSGDRAALEHELGDLLFAAVNVSRHLDVDPELALRAATERFLDRFAHVRDRLAQEGHAPKDVSLDRLDELWNEAKARD